MEMVRDELFDKPIKVFTGKKYQLMGTSGNPGWVSRGSSEKIANSLFEGGLIPKSPLARGSLWGGLIPPPIMAG
jgi:hypothetical protein